MAWKVMQGDVREKLAELPEKSVHCVVTSPPYWGLRDYGLPPSVWGGSPECEHEYSIGIELSEEYCKLIRKRMDKMQMNIFSLGVSE